MSVFLWLFSMRLRLLLSYDGTPFKGWQKQKTTSHTIQHCLEKALHTVFKQKISVIGAGRTDSGVHALAQTAHCDVPVNRIPSSLIASVNALTPPALSCHQIWKAPPEFHAQRSAQKRTYTYLIFNTKTPSALERNYSYWYPYSVFYKNLQKMSQFLKGEHDFKSFQNSGSANQNTCKIIYQAGWLWLQPRILAFQITGNGFLKQMVRNLVGTQLGLMKEKDCVQKFQHILKARDRKRALKTIPAHGLFLHRIYYPLSLDKKCQKI